MSPRAGEPHPVSRAVSEPRRSVVHPITDYGVIGNLETLALISPTGSIDWACLPHFASPSIFARLLDPERGGYHAIRPTVRARVTQEYLAGTNVLQTRFHIDEHRRLTTLDFLPIDPDPERESPPVIVRWVTAKGGAIPVRTTLDARLHYAEDPPSWEPSGEGGIAAGWSGHVTYRHPVALEFRGTVAEGKGVVRPGAPWPIEIIWGPRPLDLPSAPVLLEQTVQYWQRWVRRGAAPLARLPRPWRRRVLRSELVLKLLSQRRTGAFVAAATTSIPEWPGGPRNWDYRVAWFRDAAFSAQALLLLGHVEEAERFLGWVVGRVDETRAGHRLRVLYDAHGEAVPRERTLPHLTGFLGSQPVRIGNAAERQYQLDIYGELLSSAYVLAHLHPQRVASSWPALARLANYVVRHWKDPDQGIWEHRGPPRHYVHSKVMAWVALDRAAGLAEHFGEEASSKAWRGTADEVKERVIRLGYDTRRQSFVQAFDSPVLDAANLRLPLVRFLPFDDPRIAGTVDRIDRELARGPFVYRYSTRGDPLGPEGAFLACSFWRVECLARMGARDRARADWEELLRTAGPLRLMSEEFDPVARRPLGNYPQALTHIGVLRCAFALAGGEGAGPVHPSVHHLLEYAFGLSPPNSRTGKSST